MTIPYISVASPQRCNNIPTQHNRTEQNTTTTTTTMRQYTASSSSAFLPTSTATTISPGSSIIRRRKGKQQQHESSSSSSSSSKQNKNQHHPSGASLFNLHPTPSTALYSNFSPLSSAFYDPIGLSSSSASSSLLSSSSSSSSLIWLSYSETAAAAAASSSTPIIVKEFEPIIDWTALGTFTSIMLVFIVLIRRTAAVEHAVVEREEALELVRALKSKALVASPAPATRKSAATATTVDDSSSSSNISSSSSSGSADDEDSIISLEEALQRYEAAVIQEEQLRNIIVPGGMVRIVPPSAGNVAEENARLAAKQFLGKDYDIGVDKRERERDRDGNPTTSGKLPMVAIGILALLGVMLTGLLFLLSMDPATVSSVLENL